MTIEIAFVSASGPSVLDCHLITSRFDPDQLEEGAIEFLLVQSRDKKLQGRRHGNHRDLWRSPDGTVYAVLEDHVSWCPDAASGLNEWQQQSLEGRVTRISGIGKDLVFAYGHSETYPIHRFDGSDWVQDPAPGWLLQIHGSKPDLVHGVGRGGLIARWDDTGWTRIPTKTSGVFHDVCVVSEDEMYAVHEGGLWQGSVRGWEQCLSAPHRDLLSVAFWQDQVWVASRSRGLCTLSGAELTVVKENQTPTRMDARGDLLLCQHDKVGGTSNGEKFGAWKLKPLQGLWDQRPGPHWL